MCVEKLGLCNSLPMVETDEVVKRIFTVVNHLDMKINLNVFYRVNLLNDVVLNHYRFGITGLYRVSLHTHKFSFILFNANRF